MKCNNSPGFIMAEFRKRIIRPGKFLVKVPGTNQRKVKEFDKDYIREAYLTNTKMLEEGMLIPAPYGHSDGNKLIPVPLLSDPDSPEQSVSDIEDWKT
jgi:hypothetical protein